MTTLGTRKNQSEVNRIQAADCFVQHYDNGFAVIWSQSGNIGTFAKLVLEQVGAVDASCVFLFHSSTCCDSASILNALSSLPADVVISGCSSSGEVTPDGLSDGGIVAILLPRESFTVASAVLENVSDLGMDQVVESVQSLKLALSSETGEEDFSQVFAISLIDGLSYSEEATAAALHRGLVDIPLIGGSAGDNLQFQATSQIHNGQIYSNSAVLTLVRSKIPFKVFTNNNFVPTDFKLVVTASNPDHRNVQEFNGEPAAIVYARAIGLDPESLTPESFASHPVVVKVGGEYYCRSIQKSEDDHSLTFFCAIDNGIVLTIARPTGMVKSTEKILASLTAELGSIKIILGFDCILRRLDATNRGTLDNISRVYTSTNVIGFGTYGEQFNSMHINQTFTGIAFGPKPD